jgi:hypothetical protein
MTYEHIDDYEDRALNRQIEFFRSLINWEKLLTIYADESQEIEDVLKEFHDKLNVQFGEGETLDVYGKIFQLARGTLTDDEYRALILQAYAELNYSGEIETIISTYKSLTLATKITLTEYFPATYIANAEVDDPSAVTTTAIRAAVNKVKAAGVEADYTISHNSGAFSFMNLGDAPNSALGFGDLDNPTKTSGSVAFEFISLGDTPDPTKGFVTLESVNGGILGSVI